MAVTTSSSMLKAAQLDDATSLKQPSEKGLDVSTTLDENRSPQPMPVEDLRFHHQFPYTYPYAFLASNALSAVQDWKRSTTSSSTTPTTTTDWDDWDD
ncbi:hypothetical protein GE061_006148 [Apolygus lucorum]|uniref:Uncharacterized protein n=1 Tax=Apolygus lucorum TaxID=248454 RepID=A0A8S9WSE1_APOLU|nr:hypothetical protein GE061_006148 [Apolygus lucorum]